MTLSASEKENWVWNDLPTLISEKFSQAELKQLCFNLNIGYENLGENIGLQERALALVAYTDRHGCNDDLVTALKDMRPQVAWPLPPGKTSPSISSQRSKVSRLTWYILGFLIIVSIIFAVVLLKFRPDPVIPMEKGFNIAVAQFTTFDEAGHESVTETSSAISDWLFTKLQDNKGKLPNNLQVEMRGPKDIGAVEGITPDARFDNAAEIANAHNATVVVYGTVTGSQNPYSLDIDFYVSEIAFDLGSEIVGPERLGKPVTFTLPLTPASLTAVNAQLQTRVDVLQYVITGLSNLFILEYDRARLDFMDALDVPGWPPTEGHEVVYMLLGATALEAYDHVAHPDFLSVAENNFIEARKQGPEYSRAFLGLGAVALEKAKVVDPDSGDTIAINPGDLVDAKGLYEASLNATDQPVKAYTEAKAYYGLGETHLLGWGIGAEGWSGAQAQTYFDEVLRLYEKGDYPIGLTVLAARTHANIGLLAGHNGDMQKMVQEVGLAIDLLEGLDNPEANDWIARYWTWVARAELERNQPEKARRAYERALDIGGDYIEESERQNWQSSLTEIGEE